MLGFREWCQLVTESMDFYIKDYPYRKEMKELGDVSWVVLQKIHDQLRKIAPKANWFHKSETLAPDGDDYFKPKGTLNFYYLDLPQDQVQKISSMVKFFLQDAGVKVGAVRPETNKESPHGKDSPNPDHIRVIRFDVEVPPPEAKDEPPSLNVANASAEFIMQDLLGYGDEEWHRDLDIWQIKERTAKARAFTKQRVQPTEIEKGEKGATIIHSGYDEERITGYLDLIDRLCDWALKHGYNQIYVA